MSVVMQDHMWGILDEFRYQPTQKRVRARWGEIVAADSTNAVLVWEPRRAVPSYAVPMTDVLETLEPVADSATSASEDETSRIPILHPGIPFRAHTTPGTAFRVTSGDETLRADAFRPDDEALHDLVILDFTGFDSWLEEDEPIRGHPRDPYHRVDVRSSSRHVRVTMDGTPVAESSRPLLVFETNLPVRFYLPREDVPASLIPSDKLTYCAYKGEASYFSVEVDGVRRRDLFWSYEDPLSDAVALKDYVAFFDELVDLTVDDEANVQARPEIADAIREGAGIAGPE